MKHKIYTKPKKKKKKSTQIPGLQLKTKCERESLSFQVLYSATEYQNEDGKALWLV